MGMQGTGLALALTRRLRQAKEERRNIDIKESEQKRKDEIYKIDKQTADLNLKKRKQQGELDDLGYKIASQRVSTLYKAFKAKSDADNMMIGEAKTKNRMATESMSGDLKKLINSYMPDAGPIDLSFDTKEDKPTTVDKVLGTLENGGVTDSSGYFMEFETKNQAERYARSKLGPDYEKKYPRASESINKRFSKDGKYKIGQIIETPTGKFEIVDFDKKTNEPMVNKVQ